MVVDDASVNDNFPSVDPPPPTETASPVISPPVINVEDNVEGKRKRRAEVWSHAKRIVKKGNVVAICNYCGTEVKCDPKKHGNNGISNHVKGCKKNPFNTLKGGSTQTSLTQSVMNNSATPHVFSQKRLDQKVVEFVIRDEHSFRVVEKKGYIEMMKEAQPRFKIPNRRKIALGVWDLFAMESAKIKSVIGNQRVSITTDTWTSIQNINYMVITAHFLDNDWNLHKRIINFTKITSHKGDDIGKVLETCLSNWGIDKVFTITVDNASSNDKAVEYMGQRLNELGTLLLDGKYLHLRCCCHIINLIGKSGLKFLGVSVESIRNCVKYIHSSGARLDQFREYAILLKMDKMSTVPMDVPTRWNATYTMLSVAYKFKKVFGRMEENVNFVNYFTETVVVDHRRSKREGPPIEKDWEKAEAFMKFLKRFYETTLRLSASKTTTSTLIWEEIVSMRLLIDQTMNDITDHALQEVATQMDAKFNKYWGDLERVNKIMFICNILDPRFKLQMIEFNLKHMNWNATRIGSFVDGLRNCFYELYEAYKENSSFEPAGKSDDFDGDEECLEFYKDDPIKLKGYLEMVRFRKAENQAEIANEVDKYFADPFVKFSPTFNILEWWKVNIPTYPVLSKIAKDVFAIPSSTVASENAFSLGRRVVDPFRASLHPKMVEALVCTSDWLRAEDFNLYQEPTEDELEFYKECEDITTSTIINP